MMSENFKVDATFLEALADEEARNGVRPPFVSHVPMAAGEIVFVTVAAGWRENLRGTWEAVVIRCLGQEDGTYRVSALLADARAGRESNYRSLSYCGIGLAGLPASFAWPRWAAPLVEQAHAAQARAAAAETQLRAVCALMAPTSIGVKLEEVLAAVRELKGGRA